jgi:glycosyltransferase involved in cell wall biosynthesis
VAALRIDYVTMGFPTPSETFTALDVVGLRSRGADVHVHALRPRHGEHDRLVAERELGDVPITHAGAGSLVAGLGALLVEPAATVGLMGALLRRSWRQPHQLLKGLVLLPRALAIFRTLQAARPDVVHLCWAHYPSMVGWLVARRMPSSLLSISFSAYDIDLRFGLTGPVARRAQVLRTLAGSNVEELVEWLGVAEDRIQVVPDGIRLDAFVPGRARVPGRVVCVARMVHDKGVDAVIDAFAGVLAQRPDATFELYGDGPDRTAFEAQAAALGLGAAVRFHGHRSQEAVAAAMAEAEVFLFLSRTERLPNVLKEAMAVGCACVVSATFGVDELIPDPDHGAIVAIDDVAAATEAVLGYLDSPSLRDATGDRARRHIVARFDVERSLDRYLELWRGRAVPMPPLTRPRRSAEGG